MTPEVPDLLDAITTRTRQMLDDRGIDSPIVVGIHSGGVWVAEHLRERLGIQRPLGKLDISFYRDDFSRIGMHPQVRPSELPEDLDGEHVLLVDDVLYTGRTIRAALNELFDWGRPASVTLVVLVERDGRELPVCASVAGEHMELGATQQIKLRGPEPLSLERVTLDSPEDQDG